MGFDNITARLANLSPAKRALLELRLKEKTVKSLAIQSIPRRPPFDTAPLSFAQQRLWFLNQLEPESPAYNESNAVRLSGVLNLDALKNALSQIVERHEVLRSTIVTIDGNPRQLVANNRDVELPVIDLQALAEADRDSEVQRLIAKTVRQPFDLSRDLMLRVLLLRLAEQEHILLVVKHHIASDGWSSGIFWRELTALYRAFVSGESCSLRELPIQYADYAVWQREWLQGDVLESQLSYWKKQLDGISDLPLPSDRPRPPVQSYRGKRQTIELSEQLTEKLTALSRRQGATLFMTLLAAFQTLLYRYTGQEDIAVGSPIAGRNRTEIEGLIGFFVNTLVMRVNFSGNPTFRQLLARVREVALGAYAYQDLPFEKLVEELRPERNLSHSPLFQVMLVLQNAPSTALKIKNLSVSPVRVDSETAKFDLTLSMREGKEGLRGSLEYNTDLFNDVTISRMLGHFQTLLEGIAANPDQQLCDLPILTEDEKHQLLVEWNNTKKDYPKSKCIHELFEEQVERCPDAVAVVFEDRQLTYGELNQRANQLAHHLQKLGVGRDVLVGICMERSLEMVAGLLGILKAGGAYVPLDPAYPKERLELMLEDAQAKVLVTQQGLLQQLFEDRKSKPVLSPSPPLRINSVEGIEDSKPQSSIFDPHVQVVCLDRDWGNIARESAENPQSKTTAENLAYVIYTSGSTGKPKGVMISHRGICNRLQWMQAAYRLTERDRVLQKTPFSFDVSVWEFFWPLLNGARLVMARPGAHGDSAYLIKLIVEQKITTVHFVPSMLHEFLEEEGVEACNCLRRVICSGEALLFELQERFFTRLDAELHNLYGPTEASVDVTSWTCEPKSQSRVVPIGQPIANTQIHVLDRQLNPVPIGVSGELFIGGDGLARGYLNRSELTAEKFIPNPFSHEPGAHLYKTADLARYLPDGNVELLGRADNQVKIRGFRIELGEIESVLNQHPSVREAVVLAREDQNRESTIDNRQSTKRLVAYIVAEDGQVPTTPEVRSFLKAKLPTYMVPSAFVFLDALPLTPMVS